MEFYEFSKRDTNICKAIAIIFMVLHHSVGKYYNQFDLSWYAKNSTNIPYTIMLFFSTAGKVCVSLLTFLSGYGLAKSFMKFGENSLKGDIKFIVLRYIKLYSIYLPIALIVTIARIIKSCLLNEQISFMQVLKTVLANFTMVYKTSVGDWYLKAIVVLYLLFPILHRLLKKYGLVVILFTAVPWILRFGFGMQQIKIDSFLSCLLPFAVGIRFEQKDFLTKLKICKPVLSVIIPTVCLISTFILRLIFSLPMDIFFALSIILFEINVLSSLTCSSILNFIGRHSANIWLLHIATFDFIFFGHPVFVFVFALSISLLTSIVVEQLKKVTKYNDLVSNVSKRFKGKI